MHTCIYTYIHTLNTTNPESHFSFLLITMALSTFIPLPHFKETFCFLNGRVFFAVLRQWEMAERKTLVCFCKSFVLFAQSLFLEIWGNPNRKHVATFHYCRETYILYTIVVMQQFVFFRPSSNKSQIRLILTPISI